MMDKQPCCGCDVWEPRHESNEATPEDIADMQAQLASVANDPNMTIVTTSWVCFCDCHKESQGTRIMMAPTVFYDKGNDEPYKFKKTRQGFAR